METKTAPFSDTIKDFLIKIRNETMFLKDGKPSPKIQELIDKGYCRTLKIYTMFKMETGEVQITTTEAANYILDNLI